MTRSLLLATLAIGRLVAQPRPSLEELAPIDAHAHVFQWSAPLESMLRAANLRAVSIACLDPYDKPLYRSLAPQHRMLREVVRRSAGRVAWISSFDPSGIEQPGFAARVIAGLQETFRQGAAGVKLYKTVGMDLRRRNGAYVMPDDPALAPVLEAIAAAGKPLYAHIAEPAGAWMQPLDPADPDFSYYKAFPQWHIAMHPDRPSKAAILAARDRMLAAHPTLRVVGCHLGSMEEDVGEIAKRLDQYPNLVVDTAGRVQHLALQPREKVRAFLLKYQDRILYATDAEIIEGPDLAIQIGHWGKQLDADWKYFATSDPAAGPGSATGLGLPESVLRKLFHDNAVKAVEGFR